MVGRAFGAYPERTYYRRMSLAPRDALFVGGFRLASLPLVLALHEAGLLGPLVLLQEV
jgi:energy-coupling factor transporter transmembrane protein EcfT